MGIQIIYDPRDFFVRGAGTPPGVERILARVQRLHAGWRSKPPTPEMKEFGNKLLWATRAHSWTEGGMAVRHLRHYLENTGLDYQADMPALLMNPIVREPYDELVDLGRAFVRQAGLKPGESFHSKEPRQITPNTGDSRRAPTDSLRQRDAWYSVGTFQAWIDGTVTSTGVTVRLHLLDFYDWDQSSFTVPLPAKICRRLGNPVVGWMLDRALGNLEEYGTITRDCCKITVEDSVMNELHLMGLARNYVTRGVLTKTLGP